MCISYVELLCATSDFVVCWHLNMIIHHDINSKCVHSLLPILRHERNFLYVVSSLTCSILTFILSHSFYNSRIVMKEQHIVLMLDLLLFQPSLLHDQLWLYEQQCAEMALLCALEQYSNFMNHNLSVIYHTCSQSLNYTKDWYKYISFAWFICSQES